MPMLEDAREFDVSKAMYVPLGFASPLWLPFAAATGAGLAFWWMTRWTQTANLEAFISAMQPAETAPAVFEAPSAEPVIEAAEEISDAVVEQTEAVAEAAVETVEAATEQVEAATEAVVEAAPVVEPVAITPPAPKKKAKPAADAPLH